MREEEKKLIPILKKQNITTIILSAFFIGISIVIIVIGSMLLNQGHKSGAFITLIVLVLITICGYYFYHIEGRHLFRLLYYTLHFIFTPIILALLSVLAIGITNIYILLVITVLYYILMEIGLYLKLTRNKKNYYDKRNIMILKRISTGGAVGVLTVCFTLTSIYSNLLENYLTRVNILLLSLLIVNLGYNWILDYKLAKNELDKNSYDKK